MTAWLCLALLALDTVVSQLPHSHAHLVGDCNHAACSPAPATHSHCGHQHTGCHHSHACSHHAGSQPAKPADEPAEHDGPCDHCTLCRHQAQAALTCTVVAPPVFLTNCELLPDQQIAQLTPAPAHVYQGRGPPAWL